MTTTYEDGHKVELHNEKTINHYLGWKIQYEKYENHRERE